MDLKIKQFTNRLYIPKLPPLTRWYKAYIYIPILRLICALFRPGRAPLLLPSGLVVIYRRLELYELDAVPYEDIGPFTYTYVNKKNGKEMQRAYDLSQWPKPPTPPATPEHECDPQSMDAALWHVYNTYQSALLHKMRQVEADERYAHDCARYILEKCANRPLTDLADYDALYNAVLCPEVGMEEIEAALASTFPGLIRQAAYPAGAGSPA